MACLQVKWLPSLIDGTRVVTDIGHPVFIIPSAAVRPGPAEKSKRLLMKMVLSRLLLGSTQSSGSTSYFSYSITRFTCHWKCNLCHHHIGRQSTSREKQRECCRCSCSQERHGRRPGGRQDWSSNFRPLGSSWHPLSPGSKDRLLHLGCVWEEVSCILDKQHIKRIL